MLLAIDAGNTNIVFALVVQREDGPAIRTRWRIATDPRRTADEYAVWLHQLLAMEGIARDAVAAVVVSTVVPRALHNLEVLATKYFGVTPLIAGKAAARLGHTARRARAAHRRRRSRRQLRSPRMRCTAAT